MLRKYQGKILFVNFIPGTDFKRSVASDSGTGERNQSDQSEEPPLACMINCGNQYLTSAPMYGSQ